jgi:hypothetical protein
MARLVFALVVVSSAVACDQDQEDLIQGTWVQDDGTQIEFTNDNRVVREAEGREVEGRYEWLDPSTVRLTADHPVLGVALERITRTVVRVTPTDLLLRDEQGQVASFRRR